MKIKHFLYFHLSNDWCGKNGNKTTDKPIEQLVWKIQFYFYFFFFSFFSIYSVPRWTDEWRPSAWKWWINNEEKKKTKKSKFKQMPINGRETTNITRSMMYFLIYICFCGCLWVCVCASNFLNRVTFYWLSCENEILISKIFHEFENWFIEPTADWDSNKKREKN